MILYTYKIQVTLELIFIILEPFLQIISFDRLILTNKMFKSSWFLYNV